jgi:hypothetical protein
VSMSHRLKFISEDATGLSDDRDAQLKNVAQNAQIAIPGLDTVRLFNL